MLPQQNMKIVVFDTLSEQFFYLKRPKCCSESWFFSFYRTKTI